jgi:protein-S-isoprenylcysteine O-methyltransferase Ste14
LALVGPCLELAGLISNIVVPPPAVVTAGLVLAIAGIVATYGSQLAMGPSWRVGVRDSEQTALITSGPFRFVRNPIFAFTLTACSGVVLLLPNVVTIGSLILLFIAIELQVRAVEEPYLIRTHGDAYAQYAARVGRFLPGIGLRRSTV